MIAYCFIFREMMGDPLLKNYSVLVLDEVHERTAQIDIIMGMYSTGTYLVGIFS
jgi:HrpA-like RNA helicase